MARTNYSISSGLTSSISPVLMRLEWSEYISILGWLNSFALLHTIYSMRPCTVYLPRNLLLWFLGWDKKKMNLKSTRKYYSLEYDILHDRSNEDRSYKKYENWRFHCEFSNCFDQKFEPCSNNRYTTHHSPFIRYSTVFFHIRFSTLLVEAIDMFFNNDTREP